MFKEYQSKPVTRKAHEVISEDEIVPVDDSTSKLVNTDGELLFKHYEPVKYGDYIVFLNDDDVYHCSRKVFHDRNIVE